MLEILVIISLWQHMGTVMRGKGFEKPFWYQFCVPVGWFGGELAGALAYGILRGTIDPRDTGFDLVGYLTALVGAGIGTAAVFVVAKSCPSRIGAPPPLPNR
jgi:hypothetical protein